MRWSNSSSLSAASARSRSSARARLRRSSSNEVAIRHRALTLEDVYVIADQVNKDGSIYFKVLVKPLVNLLWIAGGVFLLGSLIALWPDAREERRLAARYRTEGALVRV